MQAEIKNNICLNCLKLPIACLETSNEISICCFKNNLSGFECLTFACLNDGNVDLLKLFQQITKSVEITGLNSSRMLKFQTHRLSGRVLYTKAQNIKV